MGSVQQKKTCEYKFHTEFQSHEPEFDYLKSLEIEEKINKIKWCRRQNASHYLLSTNDKTIKLWKVFEKSLKVVAENNLSHDLTPGNITATSGAGSIGGSAGTSRPSPSGVQFTSALDLKLPRLTHHDTVVAAVPRRTYANAHAYHINSISVNSDGETFISSDDLRINLWNLNIQDQSFNIVDIKPANMEELTEVITAAEFHPTSCNWFMYASSKGTIKLADMRESALCDQHAKCGFLKKVGLMSLNLSHPPCRLCIATSSLLTCREGFSFSVRARRRSLLEIIFLGNNFVHLRREILV